RGNRMSPTHTNKGGARYRYYVSQAVLQRKPLAAGAIGRVPAADRFVLDNRDKPAQVILVVVRPDDHVELSRGMPKHRKRSVQLLVHMIERIVFAHTRICKHAHYLTCFGAELEQEPRPKLHLEHVDLDLAHRSVVLLREPWQNFTLRSPTDLR